jgi:uncharacterized protein (UPF0332 family)
LKAEQAALLGKADEGLRAARLLLDKGFPGPAASEAYYAMFRAAKALLIGRGVLRHKHAAVIAAFGEHFAKTGALPAELHRWLMAAEKDRLIADYEAETPAADAVREHVAHAEAFLTAARDYLARA